MQEEINIFTSRLVPKHELLPEDEKIQLLENFGIKSKQLPKIMEEDPAAKALGAKRGDVIRITRNSPTAGEYYYYRIVA
ncbi:MAG: DNA-directed RNA polymerase subunit H [Candidatus Aenigmarchaeota archaeon]|nr:DNA-directed RNA polymerase subunit H [Candidatus Aenigmarchaeota archaeon]